MASTRPATEADFNAPSRCIVFKVDIYFSGLNEDPMTIDNTNYLIDVDLLEEASADSNKPFGDVSANEVSFSMYNPEGLFSPTNAGSSLYGKIKVGVPLKVYMKPVYDDEEVDWEPMGLFYVSDWTAAITGITAEVTAYDNLYNIFERAQVKLPVMADTTMGEYARLFFEYLGESAMIDSRLTEGLVYGYTTRDNQKFLNELSIGAQAYTFCGRDGVPQVLYARGPQEIKHTLTDGDQIVDISSQQSATFKYDGATVIMNAPQESDVSTLLSIKQIGIEDGTYESLDTAFSKTPVIKVTSAQFSGQYDIKLDWLSATSVDVSYGIKSKVYSAQTRAEFTGTFVDVVSTSYSDEGDSLLKVDNTFVQTPEYAEKFKRLLNAYVENTVPILELEIRGSALYRLGEKIHVVSDKYNVDFTGLLIRQQFKYDGGLSCRITLINSNIMEVT